MTTVNRAGGPNNGFWKRQPANSNETPKPTSQSGILAGDSVSLSRPAGSASLRLGEVVPLPRLEPKFGPAASLVRNSKDFSDLVLNNPFVPGLKNLSADQQDQLVAFVKNGLPPGLDYDQIKGQAG